jgi:hypothetical protein
MAMAMKTPYLFRPGTVALDEVRRYQKTMDNLILNRRTTKGAGPS